MNIANCHKSKLCISQKYNNKEKNKQKDLQTSFSENPRGR